MAIDIVDIPPISYDDVQAGSSTANSITLTIAADTVSTTINNYQVLINISTYWNNFYVDFSTIFTELADDWTIFYVKDNSVNIPVKVEKWDSANNKARLWVTIPVMTTAAKDIVLEFDNTETVKNPLLKHMYIIGMLKAQPIPQQHYVVYRNDFGIEVFNYGDWSFYDEIPSLTVGESNGFVNAGMQISNDNTFFITNGYNGTGVYAMPDHPTETFGTELFFHPNTNECTPAISQDGTMISFDHDVGDIRVVETTNWTTLISIANALGKNGLIFSWSHDNTKMAVMNWYYPKLYIYNTNHSSIPVSEHWTLYSSLASVNLGGYRNTNTLRFSKDDKYIAITSASLGIIDVSKTLVANSAFGPISNTESIGFTNDNQYFIYYSVTDYKWNKLSVGDWTNVANASQQIQSDTNGLSITGDDEYFLYSTAANNAGKFTAKVVTDLSSVFNNDRGPNVSYGVDCTNNLPYIPRIPIPTGENLAEIDSLYLNGAHSIAIAGNYAYVVSYHNDYITRINIENPSAMVELDTLYSSSLNGARGIKILGNVAYVACNTSGITSINIETPNDMVEISTLSSANLTGASEIAISGNVAYITSSSNDSIVSVNIENPNAMIELDVYSSSTDMNVAFGVDISGDKAYVVSDDSNSITSIDISTPNALSPVDSLSTSNLEDSRKVAISGTTAFVTSAFTHSITSIDISNNTLVEMSSFTSASLNNCQGIAISNNVAYVASFISDSITSINIENPNTMTEIDTLSTSGLNDARSIAISGSYAYVISSNRITSISIR